MVKTNVLMMALSFTFCGLMVFLLGQGLRKLWKSDDTVRMLGLNQRLDLTFEQQVAIFFGFPKMSIPITLIIMGGFMFLISAFVSAVAAISLLF